MRRLQSFLCSVAIGFIALNGWIQRTRWQDFDPSASALVALPPPTQRSGVHPPQASLATNTTHGTSPCWTPSCLEAAASRLARAYPDRSDRSWCVSGKSYLDGQWQGLVLIKVPKAASSTSAGVALRISARQGGCAVQWQHRRAVDYASRNATASFLFTTVRNPASRAISTIFFHDISRRKRKPTDSFLLSRLRESRNDHYGAISSGQGGFTLQYLALEPIPENSAWTPDQPTVVQNITQLEARVHNIIQEYQFLLVVERMEESLVAMSLIMGVPLGDVLTTASKVAGSTYHLFRAKGGAQCISTKRAAVPSTIQQYLESDEWYAQNYGDYLLHAAANKSLDLTIEQLGRDRFNAALQEFQRLRALEKQICAPYTQFPCSDEGTPQTEVSAKSCYKAYFDFGCGYRCIDSMLANLTTTTTTSHDG